MPRRPKAPLDLGALLTSWELALRAERKSPATVKSYGDGVRAFIAWCRGEGVPAVADKPTLNGFTAALLEAGREASTVRSRQLGVRRFSAWLAEEGEIAADPLLGVRRPSSTPRFVEPLSDDQIRALLKACAGNDMRERRAEALVRFMVETGARAGRSSRWGSRTSTSSPAPRSCAAARAAKGRVVPFGPHTARAIDRYKRARASHRLAASPALCLGDRGKEFSYDALHKTLRERALRAGISGFHPHLLRHTAARRWLAAGGSEGGLRAIAGWSQPDMLMRYTRARAAERAANEARALGLGDL